MQRLVQGIAALFVLFSFLQGCAGVTTSAGEGPAIEAPVYRVGDRWVYRVHTGWGRQVLVYNETRTVTAVGSDGITVAVSARGDNVNVDRVERWAAPGLLSQGMLFDIETRRFKEPLQYFRFPLRSGERWNQRVDNYNEFLQRNGPIAYNASVRGMEKVTTPAGTYDAIKMLVIMRLDDEEFWRWPTDSTYWFWYAPAVKGTVREERRADYLEKGGGLSVGRLPTQNAVVELVSFTPGA